MPKVLVVGDSKEMLVAVRSLARAGYEVSVGYRPEHHVYCERSRFVSDSWIYPSIQSSGDEFLRVLRQYLGRHPDLVSVMFLGDSQVDFVGRNWEQLPTSVCIAACQPEVAKICFDKSRMYTLAAARGLPVSPTEPVATLAELYAAACRIGFPCVIKPTDSFGATLGRNTKICRSIEEVRSFLPVWPVGHGVLLVQRFAPGFRHNCHIAARNGRLVGYFEQKVLRTHRCDFVGAGLDSVSVEPDPTLFAYARQMVSALNYTGVGCLQFLRDDETGATHFLELNPRLDSTATLAYRCGCDLPLLAVEIARGREDRISQVSNLTNRYTTGRRCYWLLEDIRSFVCSGFHRGERPSLRAWVGASLQSLRSADYHMTFQFLDPLPTLSQYLHLLTAAIRRIGISIFGQILRPSESVRCDRPRRRWQASAARFDTGPEISSRVKS